MSSRAPYFVLALWAFLAVGVLLTGLVISPSGFRYLYPRSPMDWLFLSLLVAIPLLVAGARIAPGPVATLVLWSSLAVMILPAFGMFVFFAGTLYALVGN